MIEKICVYLTEALNLNDDQRDNVRYGLEVFISTMFSFLTTLILSWLFNIWVNTLIILIVFALVKTTAGGAHNKSMLNCAIFSGLMFTILALFMSSYYIFLVSHLNLVLLGTMSCTFMIYYFWSPAQVPEKPISKVYAQKLRKTSFITLILIFIALIALILVKPKYFDFIVIGSCLGLLWQSITITPLGFRLFACVDHILFRMFKGGVINEKG